MKIVQVILVMVTGLSLLTISSCKDNYIDFGERLEIDGNIIDDYLAKNNITAQRHASGLRYVIHEEGDGARPTNENIVAVTYEGRLLSNGQVFDSRVDPIEFPLANLILAWQIGIPLIKTGGSITLYAPSGLCYGESGQGSIRPNSILIFDIDLLSIKLR